jgi:hypothetical protein
MRRGFIRRFAPHPSRTLGAAPSGVRRRFASSSESGAAAAIVRFVEKHEITVLNVAGPRLSKWELGYGFSLGVVGKVIKTGRAARE